ncbi:hypothetical protein SOASR030_32560 [Leminorella grimontii]|uniref:SGNH/GDSL hydrolase family protein n=1 Tax=Leminorella grimontii TaxID=82981 RepID=A0AAV5N5W7_9GAMM|nr:DUF4886 domain-containing protein [Leminorella grimontii]KFC92650.1 hypothetical protein GLGR_3759 [Leminorella grimontii ATCC 33999 = DSM 5078]GKX57144.1 hypothetical protein SOASR030_32560 [Leminorella grimontii]VFS62647.1 Uncharacterised protein [Leminorella grimontii]
MKRRVIAIAVIVLSSGALFAQADTLIAPAPTAKMDGQNKTVAFYGNSYTHYNNNLNTRLRDLARSLLPERAKGYSYRGITISSGRLGWHIPNVQFQNTLQKWDVVVLQGNSNEPIAKEESTRRYFTESATQMAKIAHEAGSKVVYFMTWAKLKKPEETQKLAEAYIDIARKTGGYVAPVGLAFEKAMKTHPEIRLYHSDNMHPSLAGTYLAACVFFATLYNQSPVGGDAPVDGDMSKETATILQHIAWDTVNEFHAPAN